METRPFGRTGHLSTVAIFGAAALSKVTQKQADQAMQLVLDAGINHIDVAPSYGNAERRLGPWLERERHRFFLGCKTLERSREGAARELRQSLERLRVPDFDLYQIHAVTSMADLDAVLGRDGALEALIEARDEGLIRYIGITGHGSESPRVFYEALQRFDFDSVLFPVGFVQYRKPDYRRRADRLLDYCREHNVGTMGIKAVSRAPWGERARIYDTWYEPFADREIIQQAVNFALSQGITGLCTAGDVGLLSLMLEACEQYRPMAPEEQAQLLEEDGLYEPLFA